LFISNKKKIFEILKKDNKFVLPSVIRELEQGFFNFMLEIGAQNRRMLF
jgi:hypothetical protein